MIDKEIKQMDATAKRLLKDLLMFGNSFEKNGERIDPRDVFINWPTLERTKNEHE